MREEAEIPRGGITMKTFLLLAVAIVVTAGLLPSLPAKILLSAFIFFAVLTEAARRMRKNRRKFILEQ